MHVPARARRSNNRSPAYPAYDLERSLEFLNLLYDAEGFGYMPLDVAVAHCGYSPTSSTGQRTIAALNHFGLLQEKGSGAERRVRISDLGKRLVLGAEDESEDYLEALRDAALSPRIYGLLFERWGSDLPGDDVLRRYLVIEREFNPNAIDSFIEDYRTTLDLAGLLRAPEPASARAPQGWGDERTEASSTTAARNEEGSRSFDIAIPLRNGSRAVLRVPVPLTEEDFDLLQSMIEANLQVMRKQIVRPSAPVFPAGRPSITRLPRGTRHGEDTIR